MAAAPREAAPHTSWPVLTEAFSGEGRAWLFVVKALLVLYLTAWLAMWLHLERPSTAMITAGVVMRPSSGTVLAKSFYRTLGTLAGSVFGVLVMCVFPQQRVLFLLCLSLWVGLCAGGATFYRNFMAYGFVLAGYTAVIVVLPAIGDPGAIFHSAVMRVSEVTLAIVVAGVVSDAIFPETLRPVLRRDARAQFAHLIVFLRDSSHGSVGTEASEQAHLKFVRSAVEIENLRASVIFEDPDARARNRQMQALNHRYMALATSFQSLYRLANRLRRSGRERVAGVLAALYAPLGEALSPAPELRHDPQTLAPRVADWGNGVHTRISEMAPRFVDPTDRMEFDTGALLLERFAAELHGFVSLQGALRAGHITRGIEKTRFGRGNDPAAAGIAVLRTFLAMSVLSAFWLASGWTQGGNAVLLATVFSGLLAASPNPMTRTGNMLLGYVAGMLVALFIEFVWLPDSATFLMVILATAPFLAAGAYLVTRTKLAEIGSGYTVGLLIVLALQNPMVYDAPAAINGAIALSAGVALAVVSFVFVPPVTGSRWQRKRQMARLRGQVELAATAPLDGLASRFGSVSHDLFYQIITSTRQGTAESRTLLAWALSVNECGRAVIELRHAVRRAHLPDEPRDAAQGAALAVGRLFRTPDAGHWRLADRAIDAAIRRCTQVGDAGRTLLPYLWQLRNVLHDDESPLAPLIRAGQEYPDAA
ncbi:MAG: FUSC family protein [Proteobacteria bacterium]|nr:FUSC family protein [Pseudomonadota bacterium]